jgi:hypothetical protein
LDYAACVAVRYFVNVAVHTNIDASAPVQVQSDVTCQPADSVTAGAEVSELDHIVTFIVSTPAVESDATGSLFIVAGVKLHVASNSLVCKAQLIDSTYVNALNVSACLAGVTVNSSTA